ncbi:MAG: 6-carboxytetrahydropterin synthase QueD [Verrucomicrobiae bacterium]|nr:6-carboxytetrahydropterin synthase QueD [Verrucomicrobiae bacterium]
MELRKTFRFDAAHRLPHLPPSHKCSRLHGHTFKVEIAVIGMCDPNMGWVLDYGEIAEAFGPVLDQLDHAYLNEIPGLENPTSEQIARFIWDRLKPRLSGLTEVAVEESPSSRCVYRGPVD